MMFVRSLSEQERQELKRLARREVGRVSERIRMILLSSKGYSVQQIADIFECDVASVRAWIERFQAEGVKGLHDRPRSGRPPKAGVVAQQQLRQTVATWVIAGVDLATLFPKTLRPELRCGGCVSSCSERLKKPLSCAWTNAICT